MKNMKESNLSLFVPSLMFEHDEPVCEAIFICEQDVFREPSLCHVGGVNVGQKLHHLWLCDVE